MSTGDLFWVGFPSRLRESFVDAGFMTTFFPNEFEGYANSSLEERYHYLEKLLRELIGQCYVDDALSDVNYRPHRKYAALHLLAAIHIERDNDLDSAEHIWRTLLYDNDPFRPDFPALFNCAWVVLRQQRYYEADTSIRALIFMIKNQIGEKSPLTLTALRLLIECSMRQERPWEAESLYTKYKSLVEHMEEETDRGWLLKEQERDTLQIVDRYMQAARINNDWILPINTYLKKQTLLK